jgi:hypothetical protein
MPRDTTDNIPDPLEDRDYVQDDEDDFRELYEDYSDKHADLSISAADLATLEAIAAGESTTQIEHAGHSVRLKAPGITPAAHQPLRPAEVAVEPDVSISEEDLAALEAALNNDDSDNEATPLPATGILRDELDS